MGSNAGMCAVTKASLLPSAVCEVFEFLGLCKWCAGSSGSGGTVNKMPHRKLGNVNLWHSNITEK